MLYKFRLRSTGFSKVLIYYFFLLLFSFFFQKNLFHVILTKWGSSVSKASVTFLEIGMMKRSAIMRNMVCIVKKVIFAFGSFNCDGLSLITGCSSCPHCDSSFAE